jgi:HEAT repeats
MKTFDQPISVKSADGKSWIRLKYNEPRPDLKVPVIQSRKVKLDKELHSLTLLRLGVEEVLHHGCTKHGLASLQRSGPQVGDILLKIAAGFGSGNGCCDNCLNRAVAAMRYFPQPQVQEWLMKTTADRKANISTRAQAILSLGYMNNQASEKLLLDVLKKDPSDAIRRSVIVALQRNIKPDLLNVLVEHAKNESSHGVLQQLVYAAHTISRKYKLALPAGFPGLTETRRPVKPLLIPLHKKLPR